MLTVMPILTGLLPIMWSQGAAADVMKRIGIAAPMAGALVTSFLLELLVYPAIFEIWKWQGELKPALRSPTPARKRTCAWCSMGQVCRPTPALSHLTNPRRNGITLLPDRVPPGEVVKYARGHAVSSPTSLSRIFTSARRSSPESRDSGSGR